MRIRTPLAACFASAAFFTHQTVPEAARTAARTREDRTRPSTDFTTLLDDVWQWRLAWSPLLRMQNGLSVERIRADGEAELAERATFARSVLARLDRLSGLRSDEELSALALRFEMDRTIEAPRYYWHSFSVTLYQSGFFASAVHPVFTRFRFDGAADAERYLRLVEGPAQVLDQRRDKLRGQAARGIRLPRPAVPGVVSLYDGYAVSVPTLLAVGEERLAKLPAEKRAPFQSRLTKLLENRVVPACRAIAEYLNDDYVAVAPQRIGLSQYPDGKAAYRYAVRRSTTLDLPPEEIRRIAEERMAELRRRMAAVRREVGFSGDQAAFHRQLRTDSRFVAESPATLESIYRRCLETLQPAVPRLFRSLPKAPYAVRRLAPELEGGMTFGQYEQPRTAGDTGYYVYNGANLAEKPTFTACALIYHELVPAHHFHVASQQENDRLHPVERTNYGFTAYNEGWGEYAASLGHEAGAYRDPYTRYGRYLMESHVIARLFVDTGLNYFGWTMDRGEQYLREATLLTDQQIRSEVLRYATDLPGQALAYGIGYDTIWRLRRNAERALGGRFDLREFHDQALGQGGMPLTALEARIDRYVRTKIRTTSPR